MKCRNTFTALLAAALLAILVPWWLLVGFQALSTKALLFVTVVGTLSPMGMVLAGMTPSSIHLR